MLENPIVTKVLRQSRRPSLRGALIVLGALWVLCLAAVGAAPSVVTAELWALPTYGQYTVFVVALLTVIIIPTISAALMTRWLGSEEFALLRQTPISDRDVVLGYTAAALIRLRVWLAIVLGLLPLLAIQMAATNYMDMYAHYPSAGELLRQLPMLLWIPGMILLGAAMGVVSVLRWGRSGLVLAVILMIAVLGIIGVRLYFIDTPGPGIANLYAELTLHLSRKCHFELACILSARMPTRLPVIVLFVAAPWLAAMALLARARWRELEHGLVRRTIEMGLAALIVIAPLLMDAWAVQQMRAYRDRLAENLYRSRESAFELFEQFERLGWLYDGKLNNVAIMHGDLHGAELSHLYARDALIGPSRLDDADLRGANLHGTQLGGASFRNADLRGASLYMTQAQSADFQGANLAGANLKGAYLGSANLEGANLEGVRMNALTLLPDNQYWSPDVDLAMFTDPDHPDFWMGYRVMHELLADRYALGRVDLSGLNLRGVIWESIALSDANLEGTDLRNTYLRDVYLHGANLRSTRFDGAVLDLVNFNTAIGLTCDQLLRVKRLTDVTLPDGTLITSRHNLEAWCAAHPD
jgi:uncharacterized protein YjbI with pentapeptide repeats